LKSIPKLIYDYKERVFQKLNSKICF